LRRRSCRLRSKRIKKQTEKSASVSSRRNPTRNRPDNCLAEDRIDPLPDSGRLKGASHSNTSMTSSDSEKIRGHRDEKKAESLTAAPEQMIREWKKAHLSALVTRYYDTLSDEEVARDKQWGAFSESQT